MVFILVCQLRGSVIWCVGLGIWRRAIVNVHQRRLRMWTLWKVGVNGRGMNAVLRILFTCSSVP